VFSNFQVGTPALNLRFDHEKARTLGIPETDVYDALHQVLVEDAVPAFRLADIGCGDAVPTSPLSRTTPRRGTPPTTNDP
jgi:hypothetical protein